MSTKIGQQSLLVIHLRKPGNGAIWLNPFSDGEDIPRGGAVIQGFYGEEPDPAEISKFRKRLLEIAEVQARKRITEARFIPRFLLSSFAFTIMYFLASLAIRTPIPFVFSIGAGVAMFVLVWISLGKRFLSTEKSQSLVSELQMKVDSIRFESREGLTQIEGILNEFARAEADPVGALASRIEAICIKEPELSGYLTSLVETRVSRRHGSRVVNRLRAIGGREMSCAEFKARARVLKIDSFLALLHRATSRQKP